nr:nucleotidyltransferase family protein [Nocardioides sp. MAH-18]
MSEAVPLACALVDHVARSQGIRALCVKGPVLTAQGLRPAYSSGDVDVLVDPARAPDLVHALRDRGWEHRPDDAAPSVLGEFAGTLRHPTWPCELDLHHRFPGFLAPPEVVFEELWERRVTVRVAGRSVQAPDPAAHSVIAGLNYIRDLASQDRVVELDALAAAVAAHPEIEGTDLVTIAEATGAETTLRPLFQRVGVDVPDRDPRYADGLDTWLVQATSTSSTSVGWLYALTREPWRRRPSLLWRAAWPAAGSLRVKHDRPDASTRELLALRWRRLSRGVAALPGAARALRSARRDGRRR